MIRIVIVEDNKTIRDGLTVLMNATNGLKCVAGYWDCESMLGNIKEDNPDLMLMDIGLPGMSGIEGIKRVKETFPEMVILVLSVYEDDENIFDAICAGASGYLIKKTPPARLIEAIQEAHAGGSPMTSHIARRVVKFFQENLRFTDDNDVNLSDREKQILSNLAKGQSYKMIADSICISIDTVRYHIRNIYKKMHVHSQSEAVAKALRKGWI